MIVTSLPLKIAVLINGKQSSWSSAVRDSFDTAIASGASLVHLPTPIIDFYDPIIAQKYPDPTKYDLIVLSGGATDPMGSDEWVLKLQAFLRTTIAQHPKQKFLGMCWGHQTMAVTHGGIVGSMDSAEIGVTKISLTPAGQKMFPFSSNGSLHIHEFHRREIQVPVKGFVALAEGNQSFVNEENTIITFQGHPELNEVLAKIFVATAPAYMGVGVEEKEILKKNVETCHDGVRIWGRVLQWVGE